MEITIGVQNTARELSVDTDMTLDAIEQALADAVASNGSLRISDARGRTVIVPGSAIAYLEVGPEAARKVGFGSL